MKIYLQLIYLIVLIAIVSCKDASNSKVTKKQIENEIEDFNSKESIPNKKFIEQKHYEYYFVNAKSGLNYRKSPKGKVLGKFPLNTQLKVIEYSRVLDQIIDNNEVIEGEWFGVENEMDTVYVFSAFLSRNFTFLNLKIYRASPFYPEENNRVRNAFISLSESYYPDGSILTENKLNDTIKLNTEQRKMFLNKIEVSESDKVFIYEIETDSLHFYNIRDFQIIACTSIYYDNYNRVNKTENDFQFGIDLGKSYNGSYENLVYIGKECPFQKGKLKPVIWEGIKSEIQSEIVSNLISKHNMGDFYRYTTNKINYYSNGKRFIAIDSELNKTVFDKSFTDGEGHSVNPLNYTNNSNETYQYQGALFKGRSPILVGLTYQSFGCPSIFFMNESEPAIRILCDNRH